MFYDLFETSFVIGALFVFFFVKISQVTSYTQKLVVELASAGIMFFVMLFCVVLLPHVV